MLKPLDQTKFATKIVEDLGMKTKPGNKRKMRYVLLQCTDCGTPFEKTVDNATRRQEQECNACKYSKDYPMKVLKWNSATDIQFECNRCGVDFNQSDNSALKHNKLGLCDSCKGIDKDVSLTYENLVDKLEYEPETGVLRYTRLLSQLKSYSKDNLELNVRKDGRVQFCGSRNQSKARLCLWLYYGYDIAGTRPTGFADKDRNNYRINNILIGTNSMKGMRRPDKYTKEEIVEMAQPYTSRAAFKKEHVKLYSFARARHWLTEVFGHIPWKAQWTLESATKEAKKYTTREDFKRGSEGAYDAMRKRYPEHRDSAYAHMTFSGATDNNAVYVWKVVGMENVYKIGMTSHRLEDVRINTVAKEGGLKADIVLLLKVRDGLATEKEMLKLGSVFEFDYSFNGSTEFRTLTDIELSTVIDIAHKGV